MYMVNKILILLSLAYCINACTANCDTRRAAFYRQPSCNIVVTKNESIGQICSLQGYEPITGRKMRYEAKEGLFYALNGHIFLGDTLVKIYKKEHFLLKKKDCVIKFGQKCNKDGEAIGLAQDTVLKR